jgi:Flp pilus assembly pilin Flp
MKARSLTTRLHEDQRGQTAIEWVLIVVVFGLPMVYVFRALLGILTEQYRMVTFMETLPFP